MNLKACIELIEDLILGLNKIIESGADTENTDELDKYRGITIQIKELYRNLFQDADRRIKDYEDSIGIAASRDNWKITKKYIEQARTARRYLISMKESLKLRESVEIKDDSLTKLKKKVEEKGIESERREKVAETKFYGAAIEIIDRLRNELKNNENLSEKIIKIQEDIKEIKDILYGMNFHKED